MSKIWDDFLNEEFVLYEDNSDNDDDTELDVGDDDTTSTQSSDTNDDSSTDSEDNNDKDNNKKDDDDDTKNDDQNKDDANDLDVGDDDSSVDSEDNNNDDSTATDDDDTSTDDMESDTDDDVNDPNAKLKDLEKSIFDQLSDEQKTLKIKELKSLYNNVYDKCGEIINSISGADRSPEQAKIYDYVMNSLTDLQKYIKDYLFQIYDSKTYIENMVQLQKYLTVLDTVSNIFEEVKNASDKQNKDN